jgi:hypothetical protein
MGTQKYLHPKESKMNAIDEELGQMSYPEILRLANNLPGADDQDQARQQRFNLFNRWKNARIAAHSWVGDLVSDPNYPYGLNAHSHGVQETLDHPDFQIVLNVNPGTIDAIFSDLVARVKEGQKFEPGIEYGEIISNYNITFIEVEEGHRKVLRVIFPDKAGNLDKGTNELSDQYELVE